MFFGDSKVWSIGDKVTTPATKIIEVKDGYAYFTKDIKIPIKPMIGVIGVGTYKEDGEWETDTPYRHGGNMDTAEIIGGSTLYFPVAVEGAMLALGDLHAVMGDGEVSGTGLEIPGEVTLEVEVLKRKSFDWPILETKNEVMVLSSEEDINEANKEALESIMELIQKTLDLSFEESLILSSLAVDLRISQLVDPKVTIRAAISKEILPMEKVLKIL